MEWFFEIFDKIAASYIWKSVLSNFSWVDWFTVAMVFVGLIYGAQNGLMREVIEIIETMVLIYVVLNVSPLLAKYMRLHFNKFPSNVAPVFSFILISALVWSAVYFIDRHFRKIMKSETAPLLRVVGGALLGVTHSIILWSFMAQMFLLIEYRPLQKSFEKGSSVTGPAIATLAPRIKDVLTDPRNAFAPKDKKDN